MHRALDETERRRTMQLEYNRVHGIVPTTIVKPIKEKAVEVKDVKHIPRREIPAVLVDLDVEMRKAADALDFEKAIQLRDRINRLKLVLGR
jgi:excinuclease ABC subunit B